MLQVPIMILFFLAGLTGLGFVAAVFWWAVGGGISLFGMGAMAFMTLLWAGAGFMLTRFYERPEPKQTPAVIPTEKAKREATDMYALIDRLLDELTPEERRYLEQRLDNRLLDDESEEDLSMTLESLLSEREERRLGE